MKLYRELTLIKEYLNDIDHEVYFRKIQPFKRAQWLKWKYFTIYCYAILSNSFWLFCFGSYILLFYTTWFIHVEFVILNRYSDILMKWQTSQGKYGSIKLTWIILFFFDCRINVLKLILYITLAFFHIWG